MTTTEHQFVGTVHPGSVPASGAERRQHDRLPFHTVVTVLNARAREFEVHRCWLGDISATGACIYSRKPLGGGELYVQILMDGLHGRFIVVEIVNERVVQSDRVGERRSPRYVYGVQFKKFITSGDVLEKIQLHIPGAP
jgi:hypothetical protein